MYEPTCQLCSFTGIISVLSTCARTCFGRGLLYIYMYIMLLLYLEHSLIMSGHLILHPKNHLCEPISLSPPADVSLCVCTHMHTFIHVCVDGVLACFSVSFSLFSMLLLIYFYDCVNNSFLLFSYNGLRSPMEKWHMKRVLLFLSLFTGVQMSCGTCTTFLEPLSHER